MRRFLFVLVFVACGGKQPASPVGGTQIGTGKEGATCALGDEHRGSAVAVACEPGLVCCYPCGVDGCDSVCMSACPVGMP